MVSLVTGASGFLGGHVLERLCKMNEDVRVLARKTSDFSELQHLHFEKYHGNLLDLESIIEAARGVDTIFHCAGAVKYNSPYRDLYKVNVEGTRNVTIAASKADVKRIVYASSLAVTGPEGQINQDALKKIRPSMRENYCRSKAEAETIFFKECQELGVEGIALRPGVIYGPRDYTAAYHWFKAIDEGPAMLVGSGKTRFPLIFIEDLVDAFIAASTLEMVTQSAYNINGAEEASLKLIYDLISRELGKEVEYHHYGYALSMTVAKMTQIKAAIMRKDIETIVSPFVIKLFGKDYPLINFQKAKEELGFEPKTTLEEGIKKTAKWYIERVREN